MVSLPRQLMSMARNNQQEEIGGEVSAEILINDRFWPTADGRHGSAHPNVACGETRGFC